MDGITNEIDSSEAALSRANSSGENLQSQGWMENEPF